MFYSIDEEIIKLESRMESLGKSIEMGDINKKIAKKWRIPSVNELIKKREDTYEKLQQLYWLREVRDSK